METTDKLSCNILISLLVKHGVEQAVISPGSRNAPLIIAMARCHDIKKKVVIDERSAAFIALGIASITMKPVALICTSGTALLNYAPAVAEAYYRQIPLIVISADRPVEWIDQDDSQTIRQHEALSNYVKKSYSIPAHIENKATEWYINRIINDALITTNAHRKSPVHINIQLDEPLNKLTNVDNLNCHRKIDIISSDHKISESTIAFLASKILSTKKVLVIAGFYSPNLSLNKALCYLAKNSNIVVLCENISNLKGDRFISSIDRTLNIMDNKRKTNMLPELVITFGGALVSRHIKQYLRKHSHVEHWHVGVTDTTIDCFTHLTKRIDAPSEVFFTQLRDCLEKYELNTSSSFSVEWHNITKIGEQSQEEYINNIGWSDLKAFSIIYNTIPHDWNIQISNGTAIRYSQLFNTTKYNRIDCNRGVSGIDGSTSTAIGASLAYDGVTLLITGDMSAQYDIGALATHGIPSKFKMIVINNGGGGIFRFINSTSDLPELEEYFTPNTRLPLAEIAQGYGFMFFDAYDSSQLKCMLVDFIKENSKPAILRINTPAKESAIILKEYFNRK